MTQKELKKLSTREIIKVFGSIAKTTYRASPSAVAIKLVGAIITALVPLLVAYFAGLTTTALAAAFGGDETAKIQAIEYILITALLGIGMNVWGTFQNYIDELTSYKINAAISDSLYEHFAMIEYWRYDDKETADMFDKAQNFAQFFARFFDVLARILSSAIQLVVSVVALLFASWWIGLVIMVSIIPSIIIQFRLSRMQAAHWRRNTEVRRKASGITWSVFQTANLAELRVYNAAKSMLKLRATYRDLDALERIEYERKFMLQRLGADALEAGAEAFALIAVALQIVNRTLPVGQFVYVQQLVSRAMSSAHVLVSEVNGIDEDLATMYDYERFMQLPRINNGIYHIKSHPQTIAFDHVSFSYPNSEAPVLRDVSFEIQRGQHVAIVGENGAGKSTTIKLLMGLYRPTSGDVLIDGVSLSEYDESSWHRQLGVLQQEFIKYQFATVKENIAFGDIEKRFSEKRFKKAIDHAEAVGFIEKLPRGRDTVPNQWFENDDGSNGVELSGGQWQRVALARNFYRDANVIILDEPTSAIDALAEARIFGHLFKEREKTIITISHRLTTVKKADLVLMMKDGQIVERGTAAELIAKKKEFYRMFESQII